MKSDETIAIYELKINALGTFPSMPISSDRFLELVLARKILSEALAIEEKYEILLQNYIDLEKVLLVATLEKSVSMRPSYSDFFEKRLLYNRMLVNLLTAARLYIDQIPNHVENCTNDIEITNLFKKSLNNKYDSLKEYRFMEAVRNYVQHKGLAIDLIANRNYWTEDSTKREACIDIYANAKLLNDDSKFKKSILKDFEENIPLKQCVRVYMTAISEINENARNILFEKVNRARALIQLTMVEYEKIYPESLVGLSAFKIISEKIVKEISIFLEYDDIRVALVEKNRDGALINLHKLAITSLGE